MGSNRLELYTPYSLEPTSELPKVPRRMSVDDAFFALIVERTEDGYSPIQAWPRALASWTRWPCWAPNITRPTPVE